MRRELAYRAARLSELAYEDRSTIEPELPPLGLNLFVLSGLTKQSVLGIARRAVPYVLSMLMVVLLLAFIPEISLWAIPEHLR